MDIVSHSVLLSIWKRGMRNGAIRRLPAIKRGLFRAAIDYSRLFGVIRNSELIRMLRGVAERIGKSLGQRIWDHGLRRALDQVMSGRVGRIFPQVRRWVDDDAYVLWLGTEILVRTRWVILPSTAR